MDKATHYIYHIYHIMYSETCFSHSALMGKRFPLVVIICSGVTLRDIATFSPTRMFLGILIQGNLQKLLPLIQIPATWTSTAPVFTITYTSRAITYNCDLFYGALKLKICSLRVYINNCSLCS